MIRSTGTRRVIKIIVVMILVPLFLFGLGALLGQIFRSAIFGTVS
jgi:hypothetical protein